MSRNSSRARRRGVGVVRRRTALLALERLWGGDSGGSRCCTRAHELLRGGRAGARVHLVRPSKAEYRFVLLDVEGDEALFGGEGVGLDMGRW